MTTNLSSLIKKQKSLQHTYRPDIDGLRAIAVLSVVIYHAFPKLIKGGFIGVDIFFVISGFLITTIIISGLEQKNFSFLEFYTRRIKRIFPALILVLLASLSFGWIALIADEYKQLGKHTVGGVSFISNFLLWQESGYFDNASETKPLLHLWSLGVEEQFYIVWPFILMLAWKMRLNLIMMIIMIGFFSFILNVSIVQKDSAIAFYSPLTRFWELLMGSVLAYLTLYRPAKFVGAKKQFELWLRKLIPYPDKKLISDTQSLLGASLIFIGIFVVNQDRVFPGWWALMPVLGAVMIISAGLHSWFNRVVLSNRLLVWFGLISYPLYLWHWPILSFSWIIESSEPSRFIRFAAVITSIILAWLTYRFIEKPLRFGKNGATKLSVLIGIMFLLGVAGYQVFQLNGFPSRAAAQLESRNSGDIGSNDYNKYLKENFYSCSSFRPKMLDSAKSKKSEYCLQSHPSGPVELAIVGDSHARHLFIGLAEGLPDINVATYNNGSTPYLNNENFNEIFKAVLEDANIKTVIISAYWSTRINRVPGGVNFENEFVKTVEALVKANKKVFIADDVPDFSFDPKKCKFSRPFSQEGGCVEDKKFFYKKHKKYYPFFESIGKSNAQVKILKVSTYFCDQHVCSMAKDGQIFYRDNDHLNIIGSKNN